MRVSFRLHLILLLAAAYAGPTLADTDPSLSQVYEAVRTGHVEQAQKMMNQVLHDHPKSAKAHIVAAEVNAAKPPIGGIGTGLGFPQNSSPCLTAQVDTDGVRNALRQP
jgi:hypothetical protein